MIDSNSIAYHEKRIKDYEEFLAKPHPEKFYTELIDFPAKFEPKRTNETHILALIAESKQQLKLLRKQHE